MSLLVALKGRDRWYLLFPDTVGAVDIDATSYLFAADSTSNSDLYFAEVGADPAKSLIQAYTWSIQISLLITS